MGIHLANLLIFNQPHKIFSAFLTIFLTSTAANFKIAENYGEDFDIINSFSYLCFQTHGVKKT